MKNSYTQVWIILDANHMFSNHMKQLIIAFSISISPHLNRPIRICQTISGQWHYNDYELSNMIMIKFTVNNKKRKSDHDICKYQP